MLPNGIPSWQRSVVGVAALAFAALIPAATLAGCADEHAPARPPMRIGIDKWAGYYPLILAQELGYLKDEGVDVDIQIPEGTDRMLAAFAAKSYDAVAVSLADVINVTRVVPELRMVLVSDESAGGDVILARDAIGGKESIRGKRIGTNLGGFGELLVRRFVQSHGVDISEVTLHNIDAAEVPGALQRADLDFGHTWEPYAAQAESLGGTRVYSSEDTPGLILDGLIFHASTLEARADETRALCRAWFRAVDWWAANPAKAAELIEKALGLPRGEVSLKGVHLMNLAENRELFRHGGLRSAAGVYIDFFVERGTLSVRPDPNVIVDGRFVP